MNELHTWDDIRLGNPGDFTTTDPSPDFCAALWLALREDDKEEPLTGERKELFENLTSKLCFQSAVIGFREIDLPEAKN